MRRLLLSLLLVGLCFLAVPQPAHAYNLFKHACTSADTNATVCKDKGDGSDPLTGTDGLLMDITNIVAFVGGAAAVIVIIVGAIRFITSGSDVSVGNRIDDDVLNARRSIINALIGLAIIVLAKLIITYVIKSLNN